MKVCRDIRRNAGSKWNGITCAARVKLAFILLLALHSLSAFAQPRKGVDYLAILKGATSFCRDEDKQFPKFTYQSSNDTDLVMLRRKYNLDSIAGFGNEVSRLLNLLHWVHNNISHDGQHESEIKDVNADAIITAAKSRHIGVSCGELATVLKDCYLAMGCPARKIYCFPQDSAKEDHDSHVIDVVYLSSEKKWIWVDPTNDAYVMDEHGALLSIEEVRARLITGQTLLVNPDANWNHKSSMSKDYYLDIYMAKNLYRFYCPLHSGYNDEARDGKEKIAYVYLYPLPFVYRSDDKQSLDDKKARFISYSTCNQEFFWQKPE